MARTVYRIVPTGQGWQLRRNETALKRYDDRDDAILEADRLARANQPSQVLIHDDRAQLQLHRDYGHDWARAGDRVRPCRVTSSSFASLRAPLPG